MAEITPVSGLISDLAKRNLIAQHSGDESAFNEYFAEKSRVIYCGFDPTADSLHVGHLVPLLMLKRFQLAGHKPLALIGGATGMIGDPSFKATERSLNSQSLVEEWVNKIGDQVRSVLGVDEQGNTAQIVNNADWMKGMDILSFLREVGQHFSVNAMIAKESVKQRINRPDQGISFTEFSYSLLQSYDFSELNRSYDCSLQIGGNDQWGNITAGIELTRRMNSSQVHGLTLPLITKSDGTKFGKTESGAVWLDPKKTSPYAFYQFWLNSTDADVYNYLRYYTFIDVEEINQIEESDKVSGKKPEAQKILAKELTRLIHGDEGVGQAERISDALFNGNPTALSENECAQLEQDGAPCSVMDPGQSVLNLLVEVDLASSKRVARELIEAGAVSINGFVLSDGDQALLTLPALYSRYYLIKKGKRHHHLIVVGE